MKYKKLSNHFWQVEINGCVFVGTWDVVTKDVQEMMLLCGY
ncbi:MAG: hypothetical protein ACRC8F_00015 [Cetobacterium sp.]